MEGLVGVGQRFYGQAGNVRIKGDTSAHTPDACAAPVAILGLSLRAGLLIAFSILDAPRGFDVVAVASCLVSGLYLDFWQGGHSALSMLNREDGTAS
ncbi:hypothetical protein F2Q69_00043363 [Brassica cretica]|uniref:Uncharacterized protein n=1 Tax=Brassica cretica TaxID=69181 RepID=A0A8S9NNJ3_BRACR|nr:hypothetical protein F2Q69_00043363 [Brassica cretica]